MLNDWTLGNWRTNEMWVLAEKTEHADQQSENRACPKPISTLCHIPSLRLTPSTGWPESKWCQLKGLPWRPLVGLAGEMYNVIILWQEVQYGLTAGHLYSYIIRPGISSPGPVFEMWQYNCSEIFSPKVPDRSLTRQSTKKFEHNWNKFKVRFQWIVFARITNNTVNHLDFSHEKFQTFSISLKFLVYFPLAQSPEWLEAVGKYCSVIGQMVVSDWLLGAVWN